MTVINMMSFGDSGAAVADEQSSTQIRKYNASQKLRLIADSVIFGGSGASDFIKEVYEMTAESVAVSKEKELTIRQINDLTKKILYQSKNSKKNEALYQNLGISLSEMQTGVLNETGKQLDDQTKNSARMVMQQLEEYVNMSILLGGLENERFVIYRINSGFPGDKVSKPNQSIGSGSDESDKVLSNYVSSIPREERDKINVTEGLVKLIEATNAASNLNVGVGGNPSIVYMSKDKKIITPNENQCILASEIVEGYTRGLLGKEFAYGAVHELVLNDGKFENYEEEMKQSCKDWKKLDRILRGYKE